MQRRALWRNRDFVLLWSGQAVSVLGTQVSTLALPLLVLALTGSPAQAGLVAASQTLPYVLFSLPAGALIDRWNRKMVMIGCDVARFLALGSLPLAAVLARVTVIQLYVVAAVAGTAYVFFSVAEVSSLARVVTPAQLPQATAANATVGSAATLLGPGLGGLIMSLARSILVGAVLAYLVDSASYLVSAISLKLMRTPFQAERVAAERTSVTADVIEGLRFLWEHRQLRALAMLNLGTNVFLAPLDLAVIVLARGALHADVRTIGLVFSIGSAGDLAGAIIAPWCRARMSFRRAVVGAIAFEALAMPLLALATSPPLLIVGWGILALAGAVYNVASQSYRLALLPDAVQGRVNSVTLLLGQRGVPPAMAAGGLLLAAIGPRAELWLIALGMGVSAVVVGFARTDVASR